MAGSDGGGGWSEGVEGSLRGWEVTVKLTGIMVDERAEEEVADGDEEDEEEEQLEADDPLHSGDVDACSSNTQQSTQ